MAAFKADRPPELATVNWLGTVDDEFRNKLAKYGLVESVEIRTVRDLTIVEWVDECIRERSDVKPSTRQRYEKRGETFRTIVETKNYFAAPRLRTPSNSESV